MRWSIGIIIALTVSLVLGPMMGPSPAAAHVNGGSGHAHPAVSHHPAPDHSQDNAKAGMSCCMLACTPVVLAASSPIQVRLCVAERLAPVLARITAMQRGEPPFHPPRQA